MPDNRDTIKADTSIPSDHKGFGDEQVWTEKSAIACIVKDKALNFLVGEVLKREPRADPQLVRVIILQRLFSSDYDDSHSDPHCAAS